MIFLIMGPPGAGKGTQAQQLCAKYALTHLSTGDMLRDEVGRQTALGLAAKEKMDSGALVPDALIIKMMLERLAQLPSADTAAQGGGQGGALLDGFPRTVEQAKALDAAGVKIDFVLELEVADEVIVERLCGRLVHPPSGRVYHVKFSPPQDAGKDDATGEPLVQRSDDNEQTVRSRLKVYHQQTAPLKTYYAAQAQARAKTPTPLITVHAMAAEKPALVFAAMVACIDAGLQGLQNAPVPA